MIVNNPLRIAQIAPIASAVSPETGRSIEHVVSLLTEELVCRGHRVTLFATGDSRTSAALHAVYERGYDDDPGLWNWSFHETLHVAAAFERAADFDVIHSHDYEFALPFTRLVSTPVLHTYHVVPNADIVRAFARYPESRVAALSQYQRSLLPELPNVSVIPHGIDTDAFPFNARAGDYLLFLGQIVPNKGPREAIDVARAAGMPLILAGPANEAYFDNEIRPMLDGKEVRYVGPVERDDRNRLLAGAAALLYPVIVSEPFGLVMIEAMTCGTPVAAYSRGAVLEIVEAGVTGVLACDPKALAERIPEALRLGRERVRRRAVERFDYRRMTDSYEALYRHLAGHTEERAS
jgi:glycosyltransferase involved in cell wall biosynthesis